MKKSSCRRYVFFLIGLSITTIVYHKIIHDDLLHPVQNDLLRNLSESDEDRLNNLRPLRDQLTWSVKF